MLAKLLLFPLLAFLVQGQITFPTLTLPWGTWQATTYNPDGDFFIFQNVRFGRSTNGTMRFKAPSYPDPIKNNLTVQDSAYGPTCPQIDSKQPCQRPGGRIGMPELPPLPKSPQSEDCLFLDIYVPSSAFSPNNPQLPVIVWIYGGAYLFGSKSSNALLYNGTGILEAAAEKVIFITGNYRVGAFGWLAGSQMERDATPNAGLYDQRLVLQWVQDYVHLVGGDKSKVSAWGESAGAGSILHHLISQKDGGGQQDPLFSKAILQSPAFQWQWDRAGTIDETYKNFSRLANCDDHSIQCLQRASTDTLMAANQQLFVETLPCTGLFPVGPSLDGKLIKQLPPVAFDSGNYWKGLKSIIVSHVHNESGLFVPKFIRNETDVEEYITDFFPQPELSGLKDAVLKQYPADGYPYWANARNRTGAIIRDMSFTCNTRLLYDAYHSKAPTYMMEYDVLSKIGLALHGTDLLPLFFYPKFDMVYFLTHLPPPPKITEAQAIAMAALLKIIGPRYQAYFTSHAIYGDPNKGKKPITPEWKTAINDSNNVKQVMKVTAGPLKFFHPDFTDIINTNEACDFWKAAARNITNFYPRLSSSFQTPEMQALLHEDLK